MRPLLASISRLVAIFAIACAPLLAGCSSDPGGSPTAGGSPGADPGAAPGTGSSGGQPSNPEQDAGADQVAPTPDAGGPPPTTNGPCTTSAECASNHYCDLPKKTCAPAPSGGNCGVNAYPSGVAIQTFPDTAASAEYAAISDNGSYPKPTCFLDLDRLYDPVARVMHPLSVRVGSHFALDELVGTELSYSHRALLSPTLVAKLDAFRTNWGQAVTLTSGYRSPQHQRAVCQGICGQDSCPGICAARSRHSWGDAADIGVYPTQSQANAACSAKFNYVYLEGNHLHLDLNPDHAICTVDILH